MDPGSLTIGSTEVLDGMVDKIQWVDIETHPSGALSWAIATCM
jgi:hypothetical protein